MESILQAPAGSPVDLAWLIPVVPAVSAAFLLVFGKRLGRASAGIAITAIGFAAVLATMVFFQLQAAEEHHRTFVRDVAPWLEVGSLSVPWSQLIDPLSSVMMLLVTWVGLLIHVYSLGYMAGDERFPRFFAYLNLFAASMLVLVTGSSLLVLFVGWELVGLCSYLLIGFWFEKRAYASAAKKAFIVNRIGDVGFLIGMFVVFTAFGSLSFADVLPAAPEVLAAGGATAILIGMLFFVGATGKSAQIPLYVWLPDAMAGPTPVSALIHAATMVTAGVYLIARMSPVYVLMGDLNLVIAWVGALTALLAALIATAQHDIKKILAYSTVSQLGYMFIGVGVGHYVAAIFHLLTHGFFKALLFLAAGSVMHGMHDETDVRRMGGLRKVMPLTFATSLVGWLAISGFPFLSGYFSKEEILAAAADTPGAQAIWVIGIVTAALTAFYMSRWFILVFLGKPRWAPNLHPHESPLSMTLPLVVLAVASAIGGLINIDPEEGFLHHWLEDSVVAFEARAHFLSHATLLAVAVIAGLAGIAYAWQRYGRRGLEVTDVEELPGAVRLAANRFYVDELYEGSVLAGGRALAVGAVWFDRNVIDGAVNGLARLTAGTAAVGRRLQTGFVRSYALGVLLGAVVITVVLLGGLAVAGGR